MRSTEVAMCEMAWLLRLVIFEAVVVMCGYMSLALFLTDNMMKKQVEQSRRID